MSIWSLLLTSVSLLEVILVAEMPPNSVSWYLIFKIFLRGMLLDPLD